MNQVGRATPRLDRATINFDRQVSTGAFTVERGLRFRDQLAIKVGIAGNVLLGMGCAGAIRVAVTSIVAATALMITTWMPAHPVDWECAGTADLARSA